MIKNILILVGGRGTRLGNLTKNTPKPLLKFNDKVFLDFIISKLLTLKTKNIYLLCHYKSNQFFKKYHNKIIKNVKIKCIKEPKPLGTGGSLYYSKKLIQNNTLVCNGDTFYDYNFKLLENIKLPQDNIFMLCVQNINYKSNKKLANLGIRNRKLYFKINSKLMNSGIYIINKYLSKYLNKDIFSLENEILEKLINKKKVVGKKVNIFNLDIGTKKNYKKFLSILKNL